MANLKRDSSGNYIVRFRVGGRGSAREWETNLTNPTRRVNATALGSAPSVRRSERTGGRT